MINIPRYLMRIRITGPIMRNETGKGVCAAVITLVQLNAGGVSLLFPDTKQVFIAPDEHLALADGRRCEGLLAHFVLRDPLEVFPRLYHIHYSIIVQEIDQSFC